MLVLLSLTLNVIYILLIDTSTLHGLSLPSVRVWTIILLVPLTVIGVQTIRDREGLIWQLLHFSIILAYLSSFLKLFDYTASTYTYQATLVIIALTTIVALFISKKRYLYPYAITYLLATINYALNRLHLNELLVVLGPIFEVAILISIIYFFYRSGMKQIDLGIVIVAAALGLFVGYLIAGFDVAPLILKTIFQQLLGVSQYSFYLFGRTVVINTQDFFALHFAEIFSLGIFMIIKKKSRDLLSVVIAGFDVSFPPQLALRSIALYLYLQKRNSD